MWYLVQKYDLYDRSYYLVEQFITKNIDKYKNNKTISQ